MQRSILQVSRLCATSGSRRTSLADLRRTCRPERICNSKVRAANNTNSEPAVDVRKLGVIPFDDDRETLMDALAFAGPAPEALCSYLLHRRQATSRVTPEACKAPMQRTNGRIAMIAFVGAAAAELATGKSILEQAATSPAFVTFMTLLLTAAGFLPKIASGVSLERLLDAAGRDGLPKELAFFNKNHELWVGRIAMLGFTGLLGVEVWNGGAFF